MTKLIAVKAEDIAVGHELWGWDDTGRELFAIVQKVHERVGDFIRVEVQVPGEDAHVQVIPADMAARRRALSMEGYSALYGRELIEPREPMPVKDVLEEFIRGFVLDTSDKKSAPDEAKMKRLLHEAFAEGVEYVKRVGYDFAQTYGCTSDRTVNKILSYSRDDQPTP